MTHGKPNSSLHRTHACGHFAQALVAVGMPALQQPKLYLSHVDRVLTAAGEFADAALSAYCAGFLRAFDAWISRNLATRP